MRKKAVKAKKKHGGRRSTTWEKGVHPSPATQFSKDRQPLVRPISLRTYIREQTLQGTELADFMLAVKRVDVGTLFPFVDKKSRQMHALRVTLDHRMAAIAWLANRAFGPVAPVKDEASATTVTNNTTINYLALSLEERKQLLTLLRKSRALPAGSVDAELVERKP